MDAQVVVPDVSRDKMLDEFNAVFETARHAAHAPRIFNLYGIAGIGKSYTLRQAFQHFSDAATVYWLSLSTRSSQLEVPNAQVLHGWQAVIPVLASIPGLEQTMAPRGATEDQPITLMTNGRPPDGSVVLLVDDVGDFAHWRWLQKDVIKPVVTLAHSMVILTSHIELFWDLSDLRATSVAQELPRFQRNEIERYLKEAQLESLEPLTQTIYDYTSGYPLAIDYFVKQLWRQVPGTSVDLARFSPGTRAQLMRYLGVVRMPEIDVLLKVMGATDDFAERAALLAARAELENQKPALLTKVLQGLPAHLDPRLRASVRHVIETEAPDGYLARCRRLEAVYYERAEARPKTWAHAFLEWLFFTLELLRAGDPVVRTTWAARFHTLFGRLRDAQAEDTSLASPTLYALFCRDAELIGALKTFDRSFVTTLLAADPAPPRNVRGSETLYDYIHATFSTLLTDDEQVNRVFVNEFDASCTNVIDALYDRLGAADALPEKLRTRDSFRVSMRNFLAPANRSPVRLDTLRQRVSMGVTGSTSLRPSEVEQVVTFFGSRGVLNYSNDDRTYSFNPLLHDMVDLAARGEQQKASLSVSLNSPQ